MANPCAICGAAVSDAVVSVSDYVIDPRWQTGPMFDPTNPLHRATAARQLARRLYADELKALLADADVGDALRAVIDQHASVPDRHGWPSCAGCPESCCFGAEPWPCTTAELIGDQLGLPIVPEWVP